MVQCRYLREGAIVPDVTVMGETVSDKTKPSLFDILLDRIELFFLGNLHLSVRPARHLDDHVEDAIVLVCKEGNIMERRYDVAVLLDKDAMLYRWHHECQSRALMIVGHTQCIRSADITRSVC